MVRGLSLSGSSGRETADAVSDIDVVALVAPEDQPAFPTAWRAAVDAIDPIVHWMERNTDTVLLNAVTSVWLRIDLVVRPAGLPPRSARELLRPLIDRDGVWAMIPDRLPPLEPDPAVVGRLVAEFIRVPGLLAVVAARGEWITGVQGTGMLRDILIVLMLQEVAVPNRGGALHLSTLLPPERIWLLETLLCPLPERDAVIAAHLALARVFFPIARALAGRLSLIWPTAFEQTTRDVLRERVGVPAADLW